MPNRYEYRYRYRYGTRTAVPVPVPYYGMNRTYGTVEYEYRRYTYSCTSVHVQYDDLSIYRICTYKYCSYWYEYKYRTAVSSVVSMCTVTVRAGDQVRIDAFLRRYLAFRSILQ